MTQDDVPTGAVVLNPAHSYRRAPPALVGCWCHDPDLLAYFFNVVRQRDAHCPAEYMLALPSAHVVGGMYLLGAGQQWFAPSITDYPPAEAALPALTARILGGDVRRLPASGKPTVMIAKAGADNFGHAMTEILPRLISLSRSPLRDVRLLLPDSMAPFTATMQSLLGLLGIAAELVFVPEQEITAVETLVFIGPVSRHNVRKSTTLLALRNLLWRNLGITPTPQRRLYVERRAHEQRSLDNAAEVRATLEAAGYETVHPGTMPFDDQVRLFSQASHIVGSLGAGLTNMLFAPPACRVTMIDPGLADYFFWDLAALAGQPFTWLFTGPISFFSQELAAATFPVDLDGLRYVLRQVG